MKRISRPILVTGSHRSGSTWAGKMLAAAPHVGYIHEPFNVGIKIGKIPKPFKYWFQYICEENSKYFDSALNRVFQYKYPLVSNIAKLRTIMDAAIITRDQGLCFLHIINNDRPLIKDPIAIFSAEWLCKKFNMKVLVMIRHPAAFCSSLIIKNWKFDFSHLLEQPLLMEKYLGKFEEEIREYTENEKSVIDQAILLWNCIHHTINIYRENHAEWIFVKHEDLSLNPIGQFQLIYSAFGLEFTHKARKIIMRSSGAHNPVEQKAGNEYLRNSKNNIYNWKNRLSQYEIERIKMKTSEISTLFYSGDEW